MWQACLLPPVQAITARSCCVCDRAGERPFPSDKALRQHVGAAHGRQLCPICLEVRVPRRVPVFGQRLLMYMQTVCIALIRSCLVSGGYVLEGTVHDELGHA